MFAIKKLVKSIWLVVVVYMFPTAKYFNINVDLKT